MADEQTPESFGPETDAVGSEGVDPAGEDLARPATVSGEYVIQDPEAEELQGDPVPDATPGKADPADVVIDDPVQLADAEQVAARARSSRPVRRKPGSTPPVPAPQPVVAEEAVVEAPDPAPSTGATAAPAPSIPRPVRRTRPAVQEESPDLPVRATPRSERPVRREHSQEVATARRTTPGLFVNQSAAELRKVIWPTGAQLRQYFFVVLLFVLFIVTYVGLLDTFFGWLVLKLFSK